MPIAPMTLRGGASSRTMENDSGTTAPLAPWITRAITRTTMFVARAARIEPTATNPRATSIIRALPNMSPSRPRIGVATDEQTRKAVNTQAAPVCEVCMCRWITGSTGTTSPCRRP